MPATGKVPRWTLPVRVVLAAMWLVHGLEKFGVKWPYWLAGGTHSVAGMLGMMQDETPFGFMRALIGGLLLPAAKVLQWPVGLLEVALGLAIATGVGLGWACLLGAGMQLFFWLGFFSTDWPPQYPLVILSLLALGARGWWPRLKVGDDSLLLVRVAVGALWLYASGGKNLFMLALGLLIVVGLGSRLLSLVALAPLWLALRSEAWGSWPWVYYLLLAAQLALLLGAGEEGLTVARLFPVRLRTVLRRSFLLGLVAVLTGTLGAVPTALAAPTTTIVLTLNHQQALVNSETVQLDTAPVLDPASGRTFVPVRFVGENLGAYLGWDGAAQKITYLGGNTHIQLWVGRKSAQVDGQEVTLDAAPYIDGNGRTLVPVRFVSERMGATVAWDPATQAVSITAPWVGRVVTIAHHQYSPGNLTVAAGTRVTWVNLDDTEHDVFGSGLESPTLATGQAYTHTFTTPGTFDYGCTFHDDMSATVTVQ